MTEDFQRVIHGSQDYCLAAKPDILDLFFLFFSSFYLLRINRDLYKVGSFNILNLIFPAFIIFMQTLEHSW